MLVVRYGFVDASGSGFGSTWKAAGLDEIYFWFGVWDEEENLDKSSNFQELSNLVERLEEIYANGDLD